MTLAARDDRRHRLDCAGRLADAGGDVLGDLVSMSDRLKIPRRLKKHVKGCPKCKHIVWCPMCGTAWIDRDFCNGFCKRQYDYWFD